MNIQPDRTLPLNPFKKTDTASNKPLDTSIKHTDGFKTQRESYHLPQHYITSDSHRQPLSQQSTYRESQVNSQLAAASQSTARPYKSRSYQNNSVDYNHSRSHSTIRNEDSSDTLREISHNSIFGNPEFSVRDDSKTHRSFGSMGDGGVIQNTQRNYVGKKSSLGEIAEKYKGLLKAYESLVRVNSQMKEEVGKCREQKIYNRQLEKVIEESIKRSGLVGYFRESVRKILGGGQDRILGDQDIIGCFLDVVNLQKMLQHSKQEEKEAKDFAGLVKMQLDEVTKENRSLSERIRGYEETIEKLEAENRSINKLLEAVEFEKKEMLNTIRSLKEDSVTREEHLKVNSQLNDLKKQYRELDNDYEGLKKIGMERVVKEENLPLNEINSNLRCHRGIEGGLKAPKNTKKDSLDLKIMSGLLWNQTSPLKQKTLDESACPDVWSRDTEVEKGAVIGKRKERKEFSQGYEEQGINSIASRTSRLGESKQSFDIQHEALQNKVTTVVEYLKVIKQELNKALKAVPGLKEDSKEKLDSGENDQSILVIEGTFEEVMKAIRVLGEQIVKGHIRNKSLNAELKKMKKYFEMILSEEKDSSQLAFEHLEKFIYNEEAIRIVQNLVSIHKRKLHRKRKEQMQRDEIDRDKENISSDHIRGFRDSKALSKTEAALLTQLTDLQKLERQRHESLYLLEKQNIQLREELSKQESQELKSEDLGSSKKMSHRKKHSNLNSLFEDVCMPITKINFEFMNSEELYPSKIELEPSLENI